MRFLIILVIFFVGNHIQAQNSENTPKAFVEEFLKAFHKQDTASLKKMAIDGAVLNSFSKTENGETKMSTLMFSEFMASLAGIPANNEFEEKLSEYRVEENDMIATVTTPYYFYYNGTFSHCGVNSFQLAKYDGKWKLVYLADTRMKEGCD